MTLDEILRARRSVRGYDRRPVSEEHLLAMGEAARLAPSACNSQTWRFIAVTDAAIIQRICDEATRPVVRNPWLREAPAVIVGCSKLDIVANRVGSTVTGVEYYQIDLGIAIEHMVLKATELGLGTCWIGWFHEKRIKAILGIPRSVKVSVLLAVGYSKNAPGPASGRKPLQEIFFHNRWNEV